MEIRKSDLLDARDLARVACAACNGCGDCCRNMGDSIHLDPYDFYQLEKKEEKTVRQLVREHIGFHEEDGLLLPHLNMVEAGEGHQCTYLDGFGRCMIHDARPGMCRLFPLGRQYEEVGFHYFVIPGGCDMPNKSKVRIESYLEIPDLRKYESYLSEYHRLVRRLQSKVAALNKKKRGMKVEVFEQNKALASKMKIDFRTTYFMLDYDSNDDFYLQFVKRTQDFLRRNPL